MIHPNSELRFVNKEIGYGVFATTHIPKGTIVYVKDQFEIELTPSQFNKLDPTHKALAEKYSYMDHHGVRIISWDHAKYVNHKCECNTMSTGYGFEIALRDIEADEEITDEYGLFNIPITIPIHCGCQDCRKVLLPTDIDNYYAEWDAKIIDALQHLKDVPQPLWEFIDADTKNDCECYVTNREGYRSVLTLKYEQPQRRPKRARQLVRGNTVLTAPLG